MADNYTEKENLNAEQNAQRSIRPANMLEYVSVYRSRNLLQGDSNYDRT